MNTRPACTVFREEEQLTVEHADATYRSRATVVSGGETRNFGGDSAQTGRQRSRTREVETAYFGYVFSGRPRITSGHNDVTLVRGQYFCLPGPIEIREGVTMVIEHQGSVPLPCFGGPIESRGRLRYINGCTDSLLISPSKQGDACLNVLFFPSGVEQTPHTHPSVRIGMVAEGSGICRLADGETPLSAGDIFIIRPGGIHAFHTSDDESMTIIAYHPDSDFGPIDEDHPMINRTLVDGVSAAASNT